MGDYDDTLMEEGLPSEEFELAPKIMVPDASKYPITITTASSVKNRLVSKYKVMDLDKHDFERLHTAVENFTHTLIHTVLQSRQDVAYQSYLDGTYKETSKVPRAAPSELWQGLATSPSLRLIAHRFLAFKLVPEEHMHYFADFTRHFPPPIPVLDEEELSDGEEINPFFLDTSSQYSDT
jgi:hypothetical protein